jgi:hypothetical protein
MWTGMLWMKWVVMISGVLMTLVYIIGAGVVLFQLFQKPKA